MFLRAIVVAALLIPTVAHARSWWAVSLDGNRCLDADKLQQETLIHGGQYLFVTPEQFLIVLRNLGASPEAHVRHLKTGEEVVNVEWTAHNGQQLARIFFSNDADCQKTISALIKSGDVPSPDDLR